MADVDFRDGVGVSIWCCRQKRQDTSRQEEAGIEGITNESLERLHHAHLLAKLVSFLQQLCQVGNICTSMLGVAAVNEEGWPIVHTGDPWVYGSPDDCRVLGLLLHHLSVLDQVLKRLLTIRWLSMYSIHEQTRKKRGSRVADPCQPGLRDCKGVD